VGDMTDSISTPAPASPGSAGRDGAVAGAEPSESGPAERRPLFQVERERRWRVWLLFGLLVVVALIPLVILGLVVGLVLLLVGPAFSVFTTGLHWYHVVPTIAVAVIGAAVYWHASHRDARRRLLAAMGGRSLDPHDRYHQRLANIVEEMRLASGSPKVDAVVIPSYGYTAFAFSDLRGGSVVGVSEGVVSELSRQQLQAVVAHEFAHVLSGSHVTVTLACLLFGMWESVGSTLDSLAVGLRGEEGVAAEGGAAPGGALVWLAEAAGGIVNGALSRQREFAADLAAARYTRDPVSLALALDTIASHPVGRGYVPPGLAALCIVGESAGPRTQLERWQASHPPVEERIDALLALANVSRREYKEQADALRESAAKREHIRPAAGVRVAPALQSAQKAAGASASSSSAVAPVSSPTAASVAAATAAAADLPRAAAADPSRRAEVEVPAPARRRAALRPCPSCGGALELRDYEGVRAAVCPGCGGCFMTQDDVARVIARHEVAFTVRQQELAAQVTAAGDQLRKAAVQARFAPKENLRPCPRCGRTMMRRHYSYDVAVEVDCCFACEAFWFDRDELEVVQIVAEQRLG